MDDSNLPGRIAILAPMPSELRPVVRELSLHRDRIGDVDVQIGKIGATEIVATKTGMGTALATRAAHRILDATAVDHLIVCGIAGGIAPAVGIGDMVVPSVVIDGATGKEYTPTGLGEATPHGKIWTSDDLVIDECEWAPLAAKGVIALDMETSALAAVCEERQIAWSVFRSISDMAGGGTDDAIFGLANPDGSPRLAAGLRYMLTHPRRIPYLVKLARDATRAANAAAKATARACDVTR